jgi:hypothetical protein
MVLNITIFLKLNAMPQEPKYTVELFHVNDRLEIITIRQVLKVLYEKDTPNPVHFVTEKGICKYSERCPN